MRKKNIYDLALFVGFVLLTSSLRQPVEAFVKTGYECEGNACSVTTMTWNQERQQFKVDNSSDQQVKVTVNTFAGSSSVVVEPRKENFLEVKTFNGPYHAVYQ
jgi:hypothetical protein